jgi:hypothetical protein
MSKDIDFTIYSEDVFYDVVDAESFINEDSDTIFDNLSRKLHPISFCDYLMRYIFLKTGFSGKYDEVDIKEYQQIIADCFYENMTPKSFSHTTAKMSALTKNWLTRPSVNRKTVFLLGFGLGMSLKDVSTFLENVQREHSFNFKDPFEVICWYCISNGYKYPKFQQLYEKYESLPMNKLNEYDLSSTVVYKNMFMSINSEDELFARLAKIKSDNKGKLMSVTARKNFNTLYYKVREIIAANFSEDAENEAAAKALKYAESARHSDMLSPQEIYIRARNIRANVKKITADDITEGDVEKFLCCGQPYDSKGNLSKFSNSSLSKHFDNKRMSRQRLHDIETSKTEVDRFDLITLNFFIYAMDAKYQNNKKRYMDFCASTNEILTESTMGKLYLANPYECFLLMCILSNDPMSSYSDVMEKSFEQ